MAKNQNLTPHQQGIVRRYYEHKDTLANQKLAEAVSELYVCTEEKKLARLWKSVGKALLNAEVPKAFADKIVAGRDLEKLADTVNKLF